MTSELPTVGETLGQYKKALTDLQREPTARHASEARWASYRAWNSVYDRALFGGDVPGLDEFIDYSRATLHEFERVDPTDRYQGYGGREFISGLRDNVGRRMRYVEILKHRGLGPLLNKMGAEIGDVDVSSVF